MTARYVFVSVFMLAGCSCKKEPAVPPPPCSLSQSYSLAPGADVAAQLQQAEQDGLATGLTGDLLLSHCRTRWQDVVETLHCNAAINRFCDAQCGTAADRESCKGARRELVRAQCREQSLHAFQTNYPACKDVKLCGSLVQWSNVPCPSG